jgi:hypothetical protein
MAKMRESRVGRRTEFSKARSSNAPTFHGLADSSPDCQFLVMLCYGPSGDLPALSNRASRPEHLLRKVAAPGIQINEHLLGDGETIFQHACKLGFEGNAALAASSVGA